MAGAFMWDNKVTSSVTITAPVGAVAASMPLSNITDDQPRLRTRFTADTVAILIDFGAAVAIQCVGLVSTTLDASATIRLRLGADSGFASPDYDSGTIGAATSAALMGNVVLLTGASISAQFLRLDIVQSGAAQIDIGRIVAGPLWTHSRSYGYGIVEGREILDRADRNTFTGAIFTVPAVLNPRFATFSLSVLSSTEATGQHRSMLAALGGAGQALWVPETTLAQAELNARSLWGSVAVPGERAGLTRENFRSFARSFSIVERV